MTAQSSDTNPTKKVHIVRYTLHWRGRWFGLGGGGGRDNRRVYTSTRSQIRICIWITIHMGEVVFSLPPCKHNQSGSGLESLCKWVYK